MRSCDHAGWTDLGRRPLEVGHQGVAGGVGAHPVAHHQVLPLRPGTELGRGLTLSHVHLAQDDSQGGPVTEVHRRAGKAGAALATVTNGLIATAGGSALVWGRTGKPARTRWP